MAITIFFILYSFKRFAHLPYPAGKHGRAAWRLAKAGFYMKFPSQRIADIQHQRCARHMIFAVGYVEFEPLQIESGSERESCTVCSASVGIVDVHFVGTAEVVAGSEPDAFRERRIDTHDEMVGEFVVPVVQIDECRRHSERCVGEAFAHT